MYIKELQGPLTPSCMVGFVENMTHYLQFLAVSERYLEAKTSISWMTDKSSV